MRGPYVQQQLETQLRDGEAALEGRPSLIWASAVTLVSLAGVESD
jgi:hypothetical protein